MTPPARPTPPVHPSPPARPTLPARPTPRARPSPRARRAADRKRIGLSDAAIWTRLQPVVAGVLALIVIGVPLWLVLVTAGKSQGEALTPDLSWPSRWHLLDNLRTVWTDGEVPAAFLGSLVLVVPTVAGLLGFGSMAAWILARRTTRLNAVLYALAISGIVLPPAIVTVVLLLRQLGLAGSAIGMIGVYLGIYMSTVVFFVTGFVRTVPTSLEEAAQIDGAGPATVFRRIILPMLRPVLATATILVCLFVWNDVFYAFFVIGGRLDTLPLNLFSVASAGLYLNNWHLIFAYVILMSMPLVVAFLVAQRRIISGITSGAIK